MTMGCFCSLPLCVERYRLLQFSIDFLIWKAMNLLELKLASVLKWISYLFVFCLFLLHICRDHAISENELRQPSMARRIQKCTTQWRNMLWVWKLRRKEIRWQVCYAHQASFLADKQCNDLPQGFSLFIWATIKMYVNPKHRSHMINITLMWRERFVKG